MAEGTLLECPRRLNYRSSQPERTDVSPPREKLLAGATEPHEGGEVSVTAEAAEKAAERQRMATAQLVKPCGARNEGEKKGGQLLGGGLTDGVG